MSWFDTHCHLQTFLQKQELEQVLQRAEDAGVEKMVTVGTSKRIGRITEISLNGIQKKFISQPDCIPDTWMKIGPNKYQGLKNAGSNLCSRGTR